MFASVNFDCPLTFLIIPWNLSDSDSKAIKNSHSSLSFQLDLILLENDFVLSL